MQWPIIAPCIIGTSAVRGGRMPQGAKALEMFRASPPSPPYLEVMVVRLVFKPAVCRQPETYSNEQRR
ncbi:hypothetical protein [Thiolapillus sp.]